MKSLFRLLLGLAVFLGAVSPSAFPNEGTNVALTGFSVGFQGCYKDGCLTPATVRFTSGGGDAETVRVVLESCDPDGTPTCWETAVPVSEGECRADLLFMPGREGAPLTVRLFADDSPVPADERVLKPEEPAPPLLRERADPTGEAFLFPKPVDARQPIWLVVGGKSDAAAGLLSSLHLAADRTPIPIPIGSLSELPDRTGGLDAVDLVVLNASDRAAFDGAETSARVLRQWLALGGKTVLFGSAESIDLLAPGGLLADFVPGEIDARHPAQLRAAPSLVRFVPKAKNLVMLGSLDSPYLSFPLLKSPAPDAQIDLSEEGKVLLARCPAGFGTSLFFAPDPSVPPLAEWDGRNGLLMKIFAPEIERLTSQPPQTGLIRLGYRDLAGQLRSALDRFDGIRPFPFSAVFTLMILFVAVIGPFDWFLTHSLFRRPNLTWVTFPLWLVLFSLLAVRLGGYSHLRQYRMNTAEITDVDAESGLTRGAVWGGVYSPCDARLDVTAVPPAGLAGPETELTWFGLSGAGLGGISSPIRGHAASGEGYALGGAALRRFPVPIRSTRSICASWRGYGAPLESRLTEEEGRLSGRLTNPLAVPMKDAILVYAGHAWFLGTLPPGESEFDHAAPKTDAPQRALTGSNNPFDIRRTGAPDIPVWERYSDTSADPAVILRAAAFYRLTGGRAALGLGNEGMMRLDASDALDAGRAILLAEIDTEQCSFVIGTGRGEIAPSGRHRALARVWIPVDRDGEEPRDP